MAVGTRSYGNSLLLQNAYSIDDIPDTVPQLKRFAEKVLRPSIKCVEEDCGTTLGRKLPIPDVDVDGLIALDKDEPIWDGRVINDSYVVSRLREGIYHVRVRDTSSCISKGGFCQICGSGFNQRVGDVNNYPEIGKYYKLDAGTRPYINHVADTYSGSIMGYSPITSDPLPAREELWDDIVSDYEMDAMCRLLKDKLKQSPDENDYLYSIENKLERALAIIGCYGVYGSVV